jgi:hypothetical protein
MKKQILFCLSFILIALPIIAMQPNTINLWNDSSNTDILTHLPNSIVDVNLGNPDQALADLSSFVQINTSSRDICYTNASALLGQACKRIKKINALDLQKIQVKRLAVKDSNPGYLLRTTHVLFNFKLLTPNDRANKFCRMPLQYALDHNDIQLAQLLYRFNPANYNDSHFRHCDTRNPDRESAPKDRNPTDWTSIIVCPWTLSEDDKKILEMPKK